MAPRVAPTSFGADNSSGSCMPAACNDWRFGVADSMSARVSLNPHQMPDIRLQASPQRPPQSISFFPWRESAYKRLGRIMCPDSPPVALLPETLWLDGLQIQSGPSGFASTHREARDRL